MQLTQVGSTLSMTQPQQKHANPIAVLYDGVESRNSTRSRSDKHIYKLLFVLHLFLRTITLLGP